MPAPKSKYCLDVYIYNFCNQLSKYIINVHPNFITYFNFIITIFLFFILISFKNLLYTFFISSFRTFLDIFDGSHARYTKQCSNFGAFLDMLNDTFLMLGLCLIMLFLCKYLLIKIVSFSLFIYILNNFIKMIFKKDNDILSNVPKNLIFIVNLIHDNTILFVPFFISIIQYLFLY